MDPSATRPLQPAKVWMLATRPRTLPAAVAPVTVGCALAAADRHFVWFPALAALAGALLLQIGVNLANDYFDFIKGIDTQERLGPLRVTQSGLIAPQRVRTAMLSVFALTLVPGFYLVAVGGWPLLAIGLASMVAALAYSGGPRPLASLGLGDLFVFIFFGPVAVGGTYYVQAHRISATALLAGVAVGLVVTAILVVNNLRDIDTDRKAGKRTLAVRLGTRGTKVEYVLLLAATYFVPIGFWMAKRSSPWILLPLVSLPLAWRQARDVQHSAGGTELNRSLAATARLGFLFSLFFSLGIVMAAGAG